MDELYINPIKINIKNVKVNKVTNEKNINKYLYDIQTTKKIVLLGNNLDKKIIDNIKSFSKNKNKNSENILKKFYGNNFLDKLNLNRKKKGKKEIYIDVNDNENTSLSNKNEIKDEVIGEIIGENEEEIEINEEEEKENEIDIDNIDIDFNDIDFNLYDIIESDTIAEETKKDYTEITKQIKQTSEFDKLYNTEISIFLEDTITQFKEKLFLITKIQPYKQYILFNNKQLGYNFLLYDNTITVNINDILVDDNIQINSIPIINNLYNNRDNINVVSRENNLLIKHLLQKQLIHNFEQLEFDIYNIDDFFKNNKKEIQYIIKNDIEQKEMIYYSFVLKYFPYFSIELFEDYIKNDSDIKFKYTDISLNYNKYMDKYKLQQDILNKHYNNIGDKYFEEFINSEFIQTILNTNINIINNNNINNLNIFNVRNIFDIVEISSIDNLIYTQYNTIVDNKKIQLVKINKYIKNEYKKIENPIESILFRFNLIYEKYDITKDLKREIVFVIDKFGNYRIDVEFNDTLQITYSKLIKLVIEYINPIIQLLNKNSFYINFNTNNKLKLINKYNINLYNINFIILWKKTLSLEGFNRIKQIFSNYINADIYKFKSENIITNEIEYNINKSVYDYKINKNLLTSNDFNYLTDPNFKQKWDYAYNNKKIIKIIPKMVNLIIEFNNITFNELNPVMYDIYSLLYNNNSNIDKINTTKTFLNHKSIKQLKQIDPLLYNYKDTGNKYSRKCQKKLQPIIVTKTEIKDKKLQNVMKYKNFTTDKENYYYCPNKKYPYPKFLQNIHPNNYCVPCCKKKNYELVENSKYNNVHHTCLTEFTYPTDIKQNDKSRYVINYGNVININRLMELPNSLDIMFNTLQSNERFYIYGIKQNLSNINNIGILFILSQIYNLSIVKFIQILLEFLNDNPKLFNSLLYGTLYKYFNDINDLISTIKNIFILNKLFQKNIEFSHWNELFRDIISYLNVYIIIFEDNGKNILYNSYKNLQYMNNIFNSKYEKINKYIYVIKKNTNEYYPIYNINFNDYFKNSIIKQQKFIYTDNITLSIKQLINNELNKKTNTFNIDLYTLNDFIYTNKNYKIIELYINKKHQCYAVILKNIKTKKHIYVSINDSNINILKNVKKTIKKLDNVIVVNNEKVDIKHNYKTFNRNQYNINHVDLFNFIHDYNSFILNNTLKLKKINSKYLEQLNNEVKIHFINNELDDLTKLNNINIDIYNNEYSFIYNFIYIEKFILLKDKKNIKIIGFVCNGFNYYISKHITINDSINILKNNINKLNNIISKIVNTKKYSNENDISSYLTRSFKLFNIHNEFIYDLEINTYNTIEKYKDYYKIIYYDPDIVNNSILNKTIDKKNKRLSLYNNSLYNKYIYNLLLIEIINILKLYKDNTIRKNIKNVIQKIKVSQLTLEFLEYNYDNILYNELSKYLTNKYFKKIINNINETEIIQNIYNNVINMISNIILKKHIKINIKYDLINETIDNNIFLFDNMLINLFKYMSKNEIILKINKLLKNSIHFNNSISNKDIDILTSCSYNSNKKLPYCYNKKLIINNKKQLTNLIHIIATDIYNPLKRDIIFSPLYIDLVMNKLLFSKYLNEKIYIKYI